MSSGSLQAARDAAIARRNAAAGTVPAAAPATPAAPRSARKPAQRRTTAPVTPAPVVETPATPVTAPAAPAHPHAKRAPSAPATVPPLNDHNMIVDEDDENIYITVRKGVILGLSSSAKTHHVATADPTFRLDDGTRMTFTMYRKIAGFDYAAAQRAL